MLGPNEILAGSTALCKSKNNEWVVFIFSEVKVFLTSRISCWEFFLHLKTFLALDLELKTCVWCLNVARFCCRYWMFCFKDQLYIYLTAVGLGPNWTRLTINGTNLPTFLVQFVSNLTCLISRQNRDDRFEHYLGANLAPMCMHLWYFNIYCQYILAYRSKIQMYTGNWSRVNNMSHLV